MRQNMLHYRNAYMKNRSTGNIRVFRVFPIWPYFQPVARYHD